MDLTAVREAINAVARKLVVVRLGTVVSSHAAQDRTQVVLDNDDTGTPVEALGLNQSYAVGSRVACLAYPTKGLLVLGPLSTVPSGYPIRFAGGLAGTGTITYGDANGARFLHVRGVGGGGAGGGAAATGAGVNSVGGGGQAGHYSESYWSVDDITFPLSYTGGLGGTGVSGATGNDGGDFVLTDADGTVLWQADGGQGGVAASGGAGTNASGGRAAWTGVGNSLASSGQPGWPGGVLVLESPTPGYGGCSVYGGGGPLLAMMGNLQGQPGFGYGGGGAGSSRRASQTALSGGAGQVGLIQVYGLH
jgi:hypothetical protein